MVKMNEFMYNKEKEVRLAIKAGAEKASKRGHYNVARVFVTLDIVENVPEDFQPIHILDAFAHDLPTMEEI